MIRFLTLETDMEAGLLGQISGSLTLTAVFYACRRRYSSPSRFQARVRLPIVLKKKQLEV